VSILELKPNAVQGKKRVLTSAFVGTTVEWYDFYAYGTAAALIFNKQFFPAESPVAGTLAAFATFAVGFIARPAGGLIAGPLGDRIGRKSLLVFSLILMGVASTAIGLLPNYAAIGPLAIIGLVVLRLLQGLACGAEWGGSALLSVEHAPRYLRGFFGSFTQVPACCWPRAPSRSPRRSRPTSSSMPSDGASPSSRARCSWASVSTFASG
jgi:MFS family permease